MLTGYSNWKRLKRLGALAVEAIYPTVQPVSGLRNGLEVYANFYHQRIVQNDIVDDVVTVSASDLTIIAIKATGNVVRRGDMIRFTSGDSNYKEIKVWQVRDADVFYLSEPIPAGEVIATNTFDIFRPTQPRVNSDGDLIVSVVQDYLTPSGDAVMRDLATGNITTSAYVDLITLTAACRKMYIDNQSGFNFDLRVNAADVIKLNKGFSDFIDFEYATGAVIKAQAIGANATSGLLTMNCFGD